MPRKLTPSAKEKRLWKKRPIEKPADLPEQMKQTVAEYFYRTGMEPPEIIKTTGIRGPTVNDAITRYQETGSCKRRSESSGRPATAATEENIKKVRYWPSVLFRTARRSSAGKSKMQLSFPQIQCYASGSGSNKTGLRLTARAPR
jgi:transposase